jgi:hypothetical protein
VRLCVPSVSKRKNRRRKPSDPSGGAPVSQSPALGATESNLAEVSTVGWMLSTLVALAAQLIWGGLAWAAWLKPTNTTLSALSELFGLIAVLVGTVSLVLSAFAIASRRVPAPRGVTIVALLIGALPWAVVGYRLWG